MSVFCTEHVFVDPIGANIGLMRARMLGSVRASDLRAPRHFGYQDIERAVCKKWLTRPLLRSSKTVKHHRFK